MKCEVEMPSYNTVEFPCIMVGDVTRRSRLYLSEDQNIDETTNESDPVGLSANNLKHSTPAPPGAKFTITLVAGEDGPYVTLVSGLRYLNVGGISMQLTDGQFTRAGGFESPMSATREKGYALPKGTISTITFTQQPSGPCKVEYKEEEPKDWLPVNSDVGSGTAISRGVGGCVVARWANEVLAFSPSEFQFMADTFQRLADEHKAKENA